MKISWNCDKTEQIIRGIEPGDTLTVELDLKELSEAQRRLLASGWRCHLVEGTQAEVCALLDAELASRADMEKHERELEKRRHDRMEALVSSYEAAPLTYQRWMVGDEEFVVPTAPGKPSTINSSGDYSARVERAYAAKVAQAVAEGADAVLDAYNAALKARAEACERESQAEREVVRARRKELGAVEFEISLAAGWGIPWGAIAYPEREGLRYEYVEDAYDTLAETLTVPCEPGDIIAYGQVCRSNPSATIREEFVVTADWDLKDL
jgi:hypothetical protein